MAYEARRTGGRYDSDDRDAERERANQNNANNIRNAAEVAQASGNAYAMAAGTAVKVADRFSGGKSTEAMAKGMTKANQMTPGGNQIQKASNQLSESGASDKIGQGAAMKNQFSGGGGAAAGAADGAAAGAANVGDGANQMNRAPIIQDSGADTGKSGGGRGGSLPSSRDKDDSKDSDEPSKSSGLGSFLGKQAIIAVALSLAPFILLLLIIVIVLASISGDFADYEDAFGMSNTLGNDTGGVNFTASSKEQEEFYNRINEVKLSYQAEGKTVDAMKIVSIYHALKQKDANIRYSDVTTSVIQEWANAMFDGNIYSETVFRDNLIHSIFPKYLPGQSEDFYKEMADEVFDYIDRYNDLIGNNNNYGSSCASVGTCSYDIKGFYLPGRGNVVKNMQISDLKVRLMECGSPYGNGDYNKAIEQDLVSFEDYAAGVAYAEVGPSANEEVLKAQMVAARSFALARPTSMGNGHGKKLEQENGQWVLQISSCVADQVFCNIDQGCSYMGGGDGQGGICRSGKVAGAVKTRDPLPADHAIRRAAAATQGEVLVNAQGYIISTGYKSTDQKNWAALAQSGLNYKQILLQSYNSSSRNYGATDIAKMSCGSGNSSTCISTGEYSTWKQGASEWGSIPMGDSGKTISQIGCLVTSVSMLIAKSGVQTVVNPFNPGTFVQYLNQHGGFASGGNFVWRSATQVAPQFQYAGSVSLSGLSRDAKFNKIKDIISQPGIYAVCEVKGNTGQHWVAIDGISGSTINMMDPSTNSTDMWGQYNWNNTSRISYFKVG